MPAEDVAEAGPANRCRPKNSPAMETDDQRNLSEPQRQFFEYAGPLFSVVISPTSSVVEVGDPGHYAPSREIAPGVPWSRI